MERTGKVTVIPKAQTMPLTREDFGMYTQAGKDTALANTDTTKDKNLLEENEVLYCIVENGKLIKRNFKELGLKDYVDEVMSDITSQMGLMNSKDGLKMLRFIALSEGGTVHAQRRGGNMETFQIGLPISQPPQPQENNKSPKEEK